MKAGKFGLFLLALCILVLAASLSSAGLARDLSRAGAEESTAEESKTTIKQSIPWQLKKEAREQGYKLTVAKAKEGFAICTIRSSKRTEDRQKAGRSDCQGTAETEIEAAPYRGQRLWLLIKIRKSIKDLEKNQAWFGLFIDGKPLPNWQNSDSFGPVITRQAVTNLGFLVPQQAEKMKLVFTLKGIGQANCSVLLAKLVSDERPGKAAEIRTAAVNLDFSEGQNGWEKNQFFGELGRGTIVIGRERSCRFAELRSRVNQRTTLSQKLGTEKLHGKIMVLEADCRQSGGSGGRIFMLASPRSPQAENGRYDALREQGNYSFKRVSGEGWKHFQVVTEVDETAAKLEFGIELSGKGRVAIRNLKLSHLDPSQSGNEAALELSQEEMRRLQLLAGAYGCLRYFYAGADLSPADWNEYLFWAVQKVLSEKNKPIKELLLSVLSPIAPGINIEPSDSQIVYRSPSSLPSYWKHTSYGADRGIFNLVCRSALVHGQASGSGGSGIAGSVCGPVPIGEDLSCNWSLPDQKMALTVLPGQVKQYFAGKPPSWTPSGYDRISRLAGVIALWNAAGYFCPESQTLPAGWKQVLETTLRKAAVDPGEEAYFTTLEMMTPFLKDDQCRIWNNRLAGRGLVSTKYSIQESWEFINNKLIMTMASPAFALHPFRPLGKSVATISSEPVGQLLERKEKLTSAATPERVKHRIAQCFLLGPYRSELNYRWEFGGNGADWRTIPVTTLVTADGIISSETTEKRPGSFARLNPDTIYVDLTRISAAELEKHMKTICRAEKVVFDCRGTLCRGNDVAFQHLFAEPPPAPKLLLPVVTGPLSGDRSFVGLDFGFKCQAPVLAGKAAFLIDTRTVGKMELYLLMVEATRRGFLVGSRSAGTAGSIALAQLPAGYLLTFTATRTLKPDGGVFQGVGVIPTEEVKITTAGIEAFKDEVLDMAVTLLKK